MTVMREIRGATAAPRRPRRVRPAGMTGVVSERKRAANRANARNSTGPRTAAGKARVAQNALRHGLTRPVTADPALAGDIEARARAICGLRVGADTDAEAADPALQFQLHLARRIAQAQVDLKRVWRARHDLIARAFADPNYRSRSSLRARNRQSSRPGEMPARDHPPPDDLEFALRLHPEGPLRQALIFADLSGELWAMDRYIGRAMSRRKFAIRDYNEALAGRDRDAMAIANHASEESEAVAQDRAPVPPRPAPALARARGEVKGAAECEEFEKREAAPPAQAILQNKATAPPTRAILQNKATAAKARTPAPAILQNKATDAHVRAPAGGAKPRVGCARMPLPDAARRIRAFLGLGTGPPERGFFPLMAESCHAGAPAGA